jgi:hypothetical protein
MMKSHPSGAKRTFGIGGDVMQSERRRKAADGEEANFEFRIFE